MGILFSRSILFQQAYCLLKCTTILTSSAAGHAFIVVNLSSKLFFTVLKESFANDIICGRNLSTKCCLHLYRNRLLQVHGF